MALNSFPCSEYDTSLFYNLRGQGYIDIRRKEKGPFRQKRSDQNELLNSRNRDKEGYEMIANILVGGAFAAILVAKWKYFSYHYSK